MVFELSAMTSQFDSPQNPLKIVVIEDNTAIVQWITNKINGIPNLELAGISNIYQGAFEMIKVEKPQVVILDLKLPDGHGLDILKEIRKAKLNIKVLIFTMNIQAKKKCLELGADYFFDKSKDTDLLIEKLQQL